ncbi:hypothetical protein [Streptomyces sp. NPDC057257]
MEQTDLTVSAKDHQADPTRSSYDIRMDHIASSTWRADRCD